MGIIDMIKANPGFFVVMLLGLAVVIAFGFFIWWYFWGRKKDERAEKYHAFMITKTGRIRDLKTRKAVDWKSDYGDGSYDIDKDSRLLDDHNRPTFIHIEGLSSPVNFKDIEKNSDIKIDAKSQKKILAAKLFSDLFSDDQQKIKDFLLIGLCIGNLIVNIIVAAKVLGIAEAAGVK